MPDTPHSYAVADEQGESGPFSVSKTVGVDGRARLDGARHRSKRMATPYPSVRSPRSVGDAVLDRCLAYLQRMVPGQYFSHQTAARIHGMPLPPGLESREPLHVSAFLPARAPRTSGVVGHHTKAGADIVIQHRGFPVASPLDVWLQLAPQIPVDYLVAIADHLLSGPHPLATEGEMDERLLLSKGDRGVLALRQSRALARSGSESPMESVLRMVLMRAGLPEPELNANIYDAQGRFIARGDLVYPRWNVLVEYDGDQHRTSRTQFTRDVARLEQLSTEGWRTIRVLKENLADRPTFIVARVRTALIDAGWRPASLLPPVFR